MSASHPIAALIHFLARDIETMENERTEADSDRTARFVEVATAILLSVAGLASAWASYQSALWGGVQASHYARATAKTTEASQLAIIDGQRAGHDELMFMAWLSAASDGDEKRMAFYQRRFSPELRAIFLPWRARYPADMRDATVDAVPPKQLQRSEHAEGRAARALMAAAADELVAGDEANSHGDRFVASTVVLSTVLFLGGIAGLFRRNSVRLAVLGLAGLMAVAALLFLATLPTSSL